MPSSSKFKSKCRSIKQFVKKTFHKCTHSHVAAQAPVTVSPSTTATPATVDVLPTKEPVKFTEPTIAVAPAPVVVTQTPRITSIESSNTESLNSESPTETVAASKPMSAWDVALAEFEAKKRKAKTSGNVAPNAETVAAPKPMSAWDVALAEFEAKKRKAKTSGNVTPDTETSDTVTNDTEARDPLDDSHLWSNSKLTYKVYPGESKTVWNDTRTVTYQNFRIIVDVPNALELDELELIGVEGKAIGFNHLKIEVYRTDKPNHRQVPVTTGWCSLFVFNIQDLIENEVVDIYASLLSPHEVLVEIVASDHKFKDEPPFSLPVRPISPSSLLTIPEQNSMQGDETLDVPTSLPAPLVNQPIGAANIAPVDLITPPCLPTSFEQNSLDVGKTSVKRGADIQTIIEDLDEMELASPSLSSTFSSFGIVGEVLVVRKNRAGETPSVPIAERGIEEPAESVKAPVSWKGKVKAFVGSLFHRGLTTHDDYYKALDKLIAKYQVTPEMLDPNSDELPCDEFRIKRTALLMRHARDVSAMENAKIAQQTS